MSDTRRLALGLSLLLPLTTGGCADEYAGQFEVSGNVTLKGLPLKEGTIVFAPLEGQNMSGGPIVDGHFRVERKNGLKPGKYLIRITAGDGKTIANEEEAGAPGGSTNIVSVDRIPPEWNVRSEKEVTVTAKGGNTFNFDIPNEYVPKSKRK